MQILQGLQEQKAFNKSEKVIAEYILANREAVVTFSIQALAKATYTSPSTIFRFCQKLGATGFKDFKLRFAREIEINYQDISNVDPDFPFSANDSSIDVAKKVLELSTDALNKTYALMSNQQMETATKMLLDAQRIGIFAYGDTFLPALNFQNKLMKIERDVQIAYLPGENQHLATTFKAGDCAIVISYSGESKNNFFIMNILKRTQAKIIVISAYPKSHIAQLGDLVLPVAKNESQTVKLSTFSSQTAIDYLLNTLYSCMFVADYEQNQKKRIASEQLFLDTRFSN